MCPAFPDAPLITWSSSTSPPPTPVETTMPSTFPAPRPAPRQCSAATTQTASLWTRTGIPGNRSASFARSGKSRQAGRCSGETTPAGHSIGPPHPQPTPASSPGPPIPASSATSVTSASRVRQSCSPSTSRGVGRCAQVISRPPARPARRPAWCRRRRSPAPGGESFIRASQDADTGRCPHSVEWCSLRAIHPAEPPPAAPGLARAGAPPRCGELRASGHQLRTVKEEIRQNLLAAMRAGEDPFPGIIGFGQTVLPHLERALLAGHDVILLGERGQGKTRLIRTLTGCSTSGRRPSRAARSTITRTRRSARAAAGWPPSWATTLPVTWRPRSDRYGEKLATPDTSVGDLIGDIDPVKVAEGRTLGDPETIHYGLVPRTNRGVFCLNELPDLAERIQVALLNVLEERDIGVRGYALRLPLDLVLVASANPEDYTNRGRIITPLKDRFGAEIRTHYPISLEAELALIRQESLIAWDGADPGAVLPEHLVQVIARFTRLVRASPAVDARSGVSARFAIAAAEAVAASAVRRAAISGEDQPVARVCDLPAIVSTLRGKVEFEVSEEGREQEVLDHLLRRAIAETFRATLGSADLAGLLAKFDDGGTVESGDLLPAADLLRRIGEVPGLAKIMERLRHGRRRVARPGGGRARIHA